MTRYDRLADLLAAIQAADQAGRAWSADYRCWPGPPQWTLATWEPGRVAPPPTDARLSVAEAAAALGLSTRMVKKAAATGTLTADLVPQPGGRPAYRISPAAIEAYRQQRLGRRGRPKAAG